MRQFTITAVAVSMAVSGALAAPGKDYANWQAKFQQDIERCWNKEAAEDVVTLRFEMNANGTVIAASIRAIPSEMQDTKSFVAARRAILSCSRSGFDLPPDQFDLWRNIQMTFKPSGDREQ